MVLLLGLIGAPPPTSPQGDVQLRQLHSSNFYSFTRFYAAGDGR